MTSENEFSRFAVASLNSMESAADVSHKLRILILAEAWLDLAEQTTQMMEHESDEAFNAIRIEKQREGKC